MTDDLTRPGNAFEKSGNANTSDDPVKVLARKVADEQHVNRGSSHWCAAVDAAEAAIRATVEEATAYVVGLRSGSFLKGNPNG